ncbi:MAG: protein-glutamate O-methyltransferase CheR [Prolixibacteraceae bacterium]|nr:protein-glutamate O-methyltransferase CheR [Prolixibacteraceae bacterium]
MDYTATASIYSQKLQEKEFKRIQEFMLKNLGVKLAPIKIVMVNSRLIKRLKATGIYTFPEYIEYALSAVGKRSGEQQCMIDELTTHKTEFFRENEQFDFLKEVVLPEFTNNRNSLFKIWSAGCSTGEEALTMAMIFENYKTTHLGFNYNIEATDVSKGVVDKAVLGVYGGANILGLDEKLRKRYFEPLKNGNASMVQASKVLRDRIKYSVSNLAAHYTYPNSMFDVVFCRNTLIYFEDNAKREVVNKLINKIKPGGYLFVGLSETVSQYSKDIKQMRPSVYKKIG